MKILHLPSTFFPDHLGGKELLVYRWIKNTEGPAVEHKVLIHARGERRTYEYEGIPVEVLPMPQAQDERLAYFSKQYEQLGGFEEVLKAYQPDIVHFHDQNIGASLSHMQACKALGIKVMLTFHSPGQSCIQRGLMHAGKEPCDGWIDLHRCTSCRYQVQGLKEGLSDLLAHIRLPVDKAGKYVKRNSTTLFYKSLREMHDIVDVIHVYGNWVKEMLVMNGVPAAKIHVTTMGGSTSLSRDQWTTQAPGQPLRLVFIGRCTNIKGIHLLVDAVKALPAQLPVEVHFFGPYWHDTEYGKAMLGKIKGDARFKEPRIIPPDQVVEEMKYMDACVIPSLWPETGPLTVFDAFAAGLPIIGTNYAGIADRVQDGKNGLLFGWNNASELSEKIRLLAMSPELLQQLKAGIRPNHTFAEMSADIKTLYEDLCR